MKLLILLMSLFISAPILAFDSYKSFPIEKMKAFIEMSTAEQLSHLQSLDISLYKFSKNEYNYDFNKNPPLEIISYIDEVPEELIKNYSIVNETLSNFNIWTGVFISKKEFLIPNNTIILGSSLDFFSFYHEVGHAFLEIEKRVNKARTQNEIVKQ